MDLIARLKGVVPPRLERDAAVFRHNFSAGCAPGAKALGLNDFSRGGYCNCFLCDSGMVADGFCDTEPCVSVIIPAFNAASCLGEALDSLKSQSYKDFEAIVIDDGSTDGTLRVAREYASGDGRIRVFHKENGGVSSARNKGLSEARGKWVMFLDADDRLSETYLDSLMGSTKESDADIVIAGATVACHGRERRVENPYSGSIQGDAIRDLMLQILDEESHGDNPCSIGILGCICSKLFKKSLLHGIEFDERVGMREDAVFNLEALSRSECVWVSKECGYFYLISPDTSSLRFHPDFSREVDAFLEDCKSIWDRDGLSIEAYHRGVLYTYMSWLKLYSLHPRSGFSCPEKKKLVVGSFDDPRWSASFAALRGKRLSLPYTTLRYAYERRDATLVILLKSLNEVKRALL